MRVSLWPAALPCEMSGCCGRKGSPGNLLCRDEGTCEWASVPCAGGCHHNLQQTCLIEGSLQDAQARAVSMQADRAEWVNGPIQCGGVQLSLWGDFALLNLKFPEGTSRRRAAQPSLASGSTTKAGRKLRVADTRMDICSDLSTGAGCLQGVHT